MKQSVNRATNFVLLHCICTDRPTEDILSIQLLTAYLRVFSNFPLYTCTVYYYYYYCCLCWWFSRNIWTGTLALVAHYVRVPYSITSVGLGVDPDPGNLTVSPHWLSPLTTPLCTALNSRSRTWRSWCTMAAYCY